MAFIKLIFITIFCVTFTIHAAYIPKAKIRILEYTIKTEPNNPYFGTWVPEILGNRTAVSVKMPIKQQLPDDMKMKSVVRVIFKDREMVVNEDVTVCEHFEKHMTAVEKHYLVPKDKFPTKCPITRCEECEIVNMPIPEQNLPPKYLPVILENHFTTYLHDENAPLIDSFMKFEAYQD